MSKKKNHLVHHTLAKVDTFNPDYSQTKRDLTRIGILAGSFILILVILSFFQDQLVALFIK
jgi:hypothetical protein